MCHKRYFNFNNNINVHINYTKIFDHPLFNKQEIFTLTLFIFIQM